jgi:outer membrane murein-binding lipoprotein Lpp
MLSRWIVVVAVGVLVVSPAAAGPQDAKDQPGPSSTREPAARLAELEQEVAALRKLLTDLQDQQRKAVDENMRQYAELKKLLQDGFSKQSEERLNLDVTQQRLLRDFQELSKKIEELRAELNRLQSERRAFYGPTPAPSTPAVPLATGTVAFVNAYWMPMTVIVDGVMVTLQPGETRTFSKLPGTFGYEVLGAQGYVTRTLAAGQTFTVQIGPR